MSRSHSELDANLLLDSRAPLWAQPSRLTLRNTNPNPSPLASIWASLWAWL